MPILFVHGVAIRAPGTPQWAALHHLTHGVDWPQIEAQLRTHVAPLLNPARPGAVEISLLYWGDLGARYAPGETGPPPEKGPRPRTLRLSRLSTADLGHWAEKRLCAQAPLAAWPELVTAVWAAVRDSGVRAVLALTAPSGQWAVLQAAVLTRLQPDAGPEPFWPHLAGGVELQQRRNVRRAVGQLRRPLEAVMPVFMGDVLCYLGGRGTPAHPGPIARRIMDGFQTAHVSRQGSGEPLVVLSHSMGGQLVYDALTAFLPAAPALSGVRVDFWASVGSQTGLFKALGLFLNDRQTPALSLSGLSLARSPHLGYAWNVWSASDLLSFPAEGSIGGNHDTAFPLSGAIQHDHTAYLHHPDFYPLLAAKVRSQVRLP